MYTSQWGQDRFIDQIFNQKRNGVFVDIGAHDGRTLSNSYFLETQRDWTGICFEPIPDIFKQLRNNRKCICIQGCAFNENCQLTFKKLTGYTEMLSGIVQSYNPEHLNRIRHEISTHGGKEEDITVEAYTLSSILSKHNITHIDYLTIDTEGSELQVLEGIDFDKVDITYIDIECNYEQDDKHIMFLLTKNYTIIHRIGNDIILQKNTE